MNLKVLTVLVIASAMGWAQEVRVPTVTRGVLTFGQLERQIASTSEPAGRERLLADDFEERLCSGPGTPIARADWLARQTSVPADFRQEAVHDLDGTVIYSALMVSGDAQDMLVDVWRKVEDRWKLAIRYDCPATGEKPGQGNFPKRY